MSKKSFLIILFLSILISIVGPIIAFLFGASAISDGFPLKWTGFSLLGSETNYRALTINILFWFAVIAGIKWFALDKYKKRTKRKLRKR